LIDHELLGVLTRRTFQVGEQKTHVEIDVDDTAICGRVLDSNGAAVAGVKVRLFPDHSKRDLASAIEELMNPLLSSHAPRRALAESVSGADGSFRLGAAPPNMALQVFVREESRGALLHGVVVNERSLLEHLEVRLVETGGIDIALAGSNVSAGHQYCAWIFSPNQPDEPGPLKQIFDDNHRVHFAHLFPGNWIVAVFDPASDDPLAGFSGDSNFVEVSAGKVTEIKLGK
jgi:hypothetical protein